MYGFSTKKNSYKGARGHLVLVTSGAWPSQVCEERGWLSLSRVDAMAQWEQRYFQQLAKQWPAAVAASKGEEAGKGIVYLSEVFFFPQF